METVPFGCYRREVFERIGVFDEELLRNQDDEFNYRLIKSGGRILLVPEICSQYFARDSYLRLWRMYFQYGLFKPLVIKKTGSVMRIRQLIPALFVISVVIGLLLGLWIRPLLVMSGAILGLYAAGVLYASLSASRRGGGRVLIPWLWMAFGTIHCAYGLGFLSGIYKMAARQWRGAASTAQWIPISR
ncbi:MAG TPA: hypothetical protein VGY99_20720 [Candidatus Binataceae bacterium]|nr:hypothetical protein [Candidatus Binataceae bacterium]